jgi:hypothetical protein
VAEGVARAHDSGCVPAFYNNEHALRAVVKSAYIAAADHYARSRSCPAAGAWPTWCTFPVAATRRRRSWSS